MMRFVLRAGGVISIFCENSKENHYSARRKINKKGTRIMSKNSHAKGALAFILAILMIVSALPVNVLAADEAEMQLTVTVDGKEEVYTGSQDFNVTVYKGKDVKFRFENMVVASITEGIDCTLNDDGSVTITADVIRAVIDGGSDSIDFFFENEELATVYLTLSDIKAEGIVLNRSTLRLEPGKTFSLSAVLTPSDATESVIWSSSDENIATVSETGVVTAKVEGEATITANVGELSADCIVTVTDSQDITAPDGYYAVTVKAPSGTDVEFYTGDDAQEKLTEGVYDHGEVDGKHQYTLVLPEGIYSYRGNEGERTLGGMAFKVPVDDEYASDGTLMGKGQVITLARINYIPNDTTVIKNTGDYSVTVIPKDVPQAVVGEQYINDNGNVVTPFLANAAGNVVTYQIVIDLNGDIANTHSIDMITNETYTGSEDTYMTVRKMSFYTIVAPEGAKVQYFRQNNNFNNSEIAVHHTENLGDGTIKYYFPQVGNATYRVSMEGKITRAGYLGMNAAGNSANAVVTFGEKENPKTTKTTAARIENSMIVNVNTQNNLKLSVGEEFRLRSYRMWQIIDYDAGNIMIEPDFNYRVISGGEHIRMTPVTERCTGNAGSGMQTNWMDIEGVSEGTAIIEVSYDAIIIGGPTYYPGQFGATEASRKAIVVIQVGDGDDEAQLNITSTHGTHSKWQWDSDLSTVYMFGDETDFSFTAKVGNSTPSKVEYSTDLGKTWKSAGSGGTYVAKGIKPGSTLIRATSSSGKVDYQVIKATKVGLTIVNMTRPGDETIVVGDTIRVMFNNIYNPTPKMSGIYNPGWTGANITKYTADSSISMSATSTQYGFAADNMMSLTFSEAGTFTLTNGYIPSAVMGRASGDHRWLTDSGCGVNMNAHDGSSNRCVLPDITFEIIEMPVIEVTFNKNSNVKVVVDGHEPDENGVYHLECGTYKFKATRNKYVPLRGSFSITGDDVKAGKKVISVTLEKSAYPHWDGELSDTPKVDDDGVYLISDGYELSWYAKNGAGKSAKLTADISMGGYGLSISGLNGTFDGNGHYITNFYHTNSLFTGTGKNAVIKNLGIIGEITGGNGIATGSATIENCVSRVDVKGGGGIGGATVCNSYNMGSGSSSGIISIGDRTQDGFSIRNTYNAGMSTTYGIGYSTRSGFSNNHTLYGSAPSTGLGGWVTDSQLRDLAETLGSAFISNPTSYNNGYPILTWEAPRALEAAQAEWPAELRNYKNAEDYLPAQKTELENAISQGVASVMTAGTLEDAIKAYDDAKAEMDKIKTAQDIEDEYAADLAKFKKEAKAELEGYADLDKYSEDDKAAMQAIIANGKNEIDVAEDIETISQVLTDAKTELDKFTPSIVYGDVNGDGKVNNTDAVLVLKYVVGTFTGTINETAADVNGDNQINNTDAVLILKYAVGTIEKFPAEK